MIEKSTPNFSIGRQGYTPQIVVIHIMDGNLEGTNSWFATPVSKVSSNYGIGLKGEIVRYVKEEDTAWAQGRVKNPTFKLYKPNVNPNLYCISLEHEGHDLSYAPLEQLKASAQLIKEICTRWNIPIDRDHIIGHYQIFSEKPNCPATNREIINELIRLASGIPSIPDTQITIAQKIVELLKQAIALFR